MKLYQEPEISVVEMSFEAVTDSLPILSGGESGGIFE